MGWWEDLVANWKLFASVFGIGSLAAASFLILRRSHLSVGAPKTRSQLRNSSRGDGTSSSTKSTTLLSQKKSPAPRKPAPGQFLNPKDCDITFEKAKQIRPEELKAVMDRCRERGDDGSLVNVLFVQVQELFGAVEAELGKTGPTPELLNLFEVTLGLFQTAIQAAARVNHQFGPSLEMQFGSILVRYTNSNQKEGADYMQKGMTKFLDLLKTDPSLNVIVPSHLTSCLNTLMTRFYTKTQGGSYDEGLNFLQNFIDKYSALNLPDDRPPEVIRPPESEVANDEGHPELVGRCDEPTVQVVWNLLILAHMLSHGKNELVLQHLEKMRSEGLTAKDAMTLEYYLASQILLARAYQNLKRYDEAEAILKMLIEWHLAQSNLMVEQLTIQSPENAPLRNPQEPILASALQIYEERLLNPIIMQFPNIIKFYQEVNRPEEAKILADRAKEAVARQVKLLAEAFGASRVDAKIADRFNRQLEEVQKEAPLHAEIETPTPTPSTAPEGSFASLD